MQSSIALSALFIIKVSSKSTPGLKIAFIASSGVKMLIAEKVDFGKAKNIFVASAILVAGIGGLAFKFGDPLNPTIQITSVAVAMILGIVLNVCLREKKADSSTEDKAEQFKDKLI